MLIEAILDTSLYPTKVNPTLLDERTGHDISIYQEIANCNFDVSSCVCMYFQRVHYSDVQTCLGF